MFNNYFTKNLKEDEEVIRIVKIYPLAILHRVLLSLLLILLAFFFMFVLFKQGTWGVILFLILLIGGIIYGIRQWVIWSLNGFVVTNKRIIDFDQKGFFNKIVSECSLDKIQDVSYEVKGPRQTMFNYGTVKLQTAGSHPTIEIDQVLNPHKLQELIADTQRRFAGGQSENDEKEMTASELLAILHRIRAEIGEEEFENIIKKRKTPKE